MDNSNYSIDRTGWPTGPWDLEGDREEWKTKAGLPGLMVRNRYGAWCGYAAVLPGHPYYKEYYDEIDISVHGGLTYAGACQGNICHTPPPGEPDDVWWLGFDCAHFDDMYPTLFRIETRYRTHIPGFKLFPKTYKDTQYVRIEVESLALQLSLVTNLVEK